MPFLLNRLPPYPAPHSPLPFPLVQPVPTLPVPPVELATAMGLVFIGAVLQGSIGFGLAVVSAPILLLVNPVFVPGPMLFSALVLVILMALRNRRDVIVRDVALAAAGRIIGTIPAAYAIKRLSESEALFERLFAVLVIIGVVLSLGWHVRRTPLTVVLTAALSGFIGTISSIGGPAMAIIYQHEVGPTIRGTLSAIFTIGTLISMAGLWWAGRFGAVELTLGVLLMPSVVVGFLVSRYTARRLDEAHTRPAVLAISLASALTILLRAVW